MVGCFEKYENCSYIIFGLGNTWLFLIYMFIFLLCIAHPFCVCGDDRITCYPGADDVTGGPGDA